MILHTAVEHHLPQDARPDILYIVSDMEFDCCAQDAGSGNFEYAKRSFEQRGYKLPVSGEFLPERHMREVLARARYEAVTA